jgi:hypothetical protein
MQNLHTPSTGTSHMDIQFEKFCFLFQKLCEQCCTVALLETHSNHAKERSLLQHTLSTIVSQARTTVILGKLKFFNYTIQPDNSNSSSKIQTLFSNCKFFGEKLWKLLKYPSTPSIRSLIVEFILILDKFITSSVAPHLQLITTVSLPTYLLPKKPTQPSVSTQATSTAIVIDPYLRSLRDNYYYPLSAIDMDMDQDTINPSTTNQQTQQPATLRQNMVVTVEDSMEVIDDLLQELNMVTTEPSPPTDSLASPPAIIKIDKPVNKLRFSLIRKNTPTGINGKGNSLPQLKNFLNLIISINSQIKILPIRNDTNVHPIKTSDQVMDLSLVGAKHYIKQMKSSFKSLNGDYHIVSPYTFDDFKSHPKIASWLELNGYNIIYNECQESDMVLIGLMSRVSSITWRDDLKREIMNTEEWSKNPFYFRLYPSTLSSNLKGVMTPVLLVDVDRPNIDRGMTFFRTTFDGENKISSCGTSYTFFSLYKNTLTDDDRIKIITDNELHVGHTSFIHMRGIKDVDTIVTLQQNVKVKLRKLLLSLHAADTTNGRIFHQIERQADPEWLTCAFHKADADHVVAKLQTIAPALRSYIIKEDLDQVFSTPDFTLQFVTKTIPIKRGNMQVASKPICSTTQAHTDKMLSKLLATPTKRAIETLPATNKIHQQMSATIRKQQPLNAWHSKPTVSTASVSSLEATATPSDDQSTTSPAERRFLLLEQNIIQGNDRMERLENICLQLKHSTDMIGNQLQQLANDFYSSPPPPSPNDRSNKMARTTASQDY